jgi:hypothetical protein
MYDHRNHNAYVRVETIHLSYVRFEIRAIMSSALNGSTIAFLVAAGFAGELLGTKCVCWLNGKAGIQTAFEV